MDHFLSQRLFDYKIHEAQIIKIHEKCKSYGQLFPIAGNQLSIDQIAIDSKGFAKALAKDLKSGDYKIEPGLLRPIIVKGKQRIIFKFNLTDTIIHASISDIINEHCQKNFSKNLHSYIKGRNYWKTIQNFALFCKKHFNQNIPQKDKGLYILRRDIANYTDTIPTDESSPLWKLLLQEIQFPDSPSALDARAWQYAQEVIRAEVKETKSGDPYRRDKGVPTGSPISTTLFNIYMVELDREMDRISPEFYARYGDDLIVADKNVLKTNQISKVIEKVLHEHRLESKKEKEASLYLTIPGRHPAKYENGITGAYTGRDRLTFLGCDVMASGTIAMGAKMEKELISEITRRLLNTKRLLSQNTPLKGQKEETQIKPIGKDTCLLKTYCQSINSMFDPNSPLAHKCAGLLRYALTDRQCLKRLDYCIARAILKEYTESPSIKAFRSLSIKDMRKAGLQSLVNNRNMVGKQRSYYTSRNIPTKPLQKT